MKHYGFNFQWMYIWGPDRKPEPADEKALDFLAAFGFNFVRIPVDYRFWMKDFDYCHPDQSMFESIDQYLRACQSRGIRVCLNLHRRRAYGTNRNRRDRVNLWRDAIAQSPFISWRESFPCRYEAV